MAEQQQGLESIVGKSLIICDGGIELQDPIVENKVLQPGMRINYRGQDDEREGIVKMISLYWGMWKVVTEDAKTKHSIITPLKSILSILPNLPFDLRTEVNAGDEYNINVRYPDGIKSVVARVITQSSLEPNSDTYLKVPASGDICYLRTAALKTAKPLPKILAHYGIKAVSQQAS